ncbi:carbohydrate porin [Bradyrhizobium sp. BR13661]|uniref:carbohydrate porin n=1 Tax=Bradyrhizobium sp. BR13661 TaxID=2940622 RepID=UPI0024757E25|nr:carbohydrate porin [Bradyrhizobium sp. BR13661]
MTRDLGIFARAGVADGSVESYEFTDIDTTAAAGLSLSGASWNRPNDTLGLAGVINAAVLSRCREAWHTGRRRLAAQPGSGEDPRQLLQLSDIGVARDLELSVDDEPRLQSGPLPGLGFRRPAVRAVSTMRQPLNWRSRGISAQLRVARNHRT